MQPQLPLTRSHLSIPPASDSLRGQDAARRVTQYRYSVELFRRNYEELVVFLDYFCAPSVAFSFSPVEQQWLSQEGTKEVTFLLHNFVAAAQSLIDHTRVLYRQLYEPQGKIPEYSGEVQNRFTTDPLSQFVIKLRQMAQHYRLPSLGHHTQISDIREGRAGTVSIEMKLNTEDLRQFDGWTVPARRFLDAAGPAINLRTVIQKYFEHVADFYEWFGQKQREIHGIGPDAYQQLLTHGNYAGPRREVVELEQGITELEKMPKEQITFADVERAFSPAFSILDVRRLMLCRHDGRLWIEKALLAIKSRLNIPPTLEERVLHLVDAGSSSTD